MKRKPKKGINPKFKKAVRECVNKYRRILGVNDFEGETLYMADPCPTDEKGSVCRGEIMVDLRYLTFQMRIYPACIASWEKEGDSAVEEVVSHEMAHIVTQHMMDLATAPYKMRSEMHDAWERLTEKVSRLANRIAENESK